MAELVLYQFTLSPYCIKVRRILEYKKLRYRTVEVNPLARGEVVSLSGQKRLPILVVNTGSGPESGRNRVISDSTRIAEYLDEACPSPSVYPSDPTERARIASLEDWSDETFAGDLIPFKIFTPGNARRMVAQSKAFYPKRWYYEALFPLGPTLLKSLTRGRRRGRTLERLRADYEEGLDRLETMAAFHAYLASLQPTVFDFAVWGLLRTMEGLVGEELLTRRPSLAAWYERVRAL